MPIDNFTPFALFPVLFSYCKFPFYKKLSIINYKFDFTSLA